MRMHMCFLGASFRNVQQIHYLAGCDRLTISPKLLQELAKSTIPVVRYLDPLTCVYSSGSKIVGINEAMFRSELAKDIMASEKLLEGIESFTADTMKLEGIIEAKLNMMEE